MYYLQTFRFLKEPLFQEKENQHKQLTTKLALHAKTCFALDHENEGHHYILFVAYNVFFPDFWFELW